MLRLSNLIRNLPGKESGIQHFWIDTICCPPDDAGQNEAQELAIGKMSETYENARAVLVIDSWLQTHNIVNPVDTNTEILMRIVCSNWNSRLWTPQEGALAKMLFFQFANKSYNVDVGLQTQQNRSTMFKIFIKIPHQPEGA
ncbi:hypothetical protein K440DRAFT_391393 [Wilcoxina mikolae CBS 423.85]|nr:hypothetical protein K440DRAFT_391393 [Wilcoxina mikolae CBS 423.85]